MLDRRTFLSLIAGSIAAPRLSAAAQASSKVALYANVGPELTHYDLDVAGGGLIRKETVTLPAGVQYAWPHASRASANALRQTAIFRSLAMADFWRPVSVRAK